MAGVYRVWVGVPGGEAEVLVEVAEGQLDELLELGGGASGRDAGEDASAHLVGELVERPGVCSHENEVQVRVGGLDGLGDGVGLAVETLRRERRTLGERLASAAQARLAESAGARF